MSVRGQWILIGVIFAIGVAMIVLVPRVTGIDGKLVAPHGPFDEGPFADHAGVPNRTIVVTRPGSEEVVARAVTDENGYFSISIEPGHYTVDVLPLPPSAPGIHADARDQVSVGLFGHAQVTLVFRIR